VPQFARNLDLIRRRGGIDISGSARSGLIMPNTVTTDVRRAIEDAKVIMFTVPAYGHRTFFDACAPYLKGGQIVVFNTGYYAGMRLGQELERLGRDVIVAERPSLVYLCRLTGPAQVFVDGLKRSSQIAAFRASDTGTVIDALKDAYPQFDPCL
jgi:opine dehydrogenase